MCEKIVALPNILFGRVTEDEGAVMVEVGRIEPV